MSERGILAATAVALTAVAVVALTPLLPVGAEEDGRELESLSGTLERGALGYVVAGTELRFGPDAPLRATPAPHDLDADGRTETLAREIAGLVGAEVSLTVTDGDAGIVEVLAINGSAYRDLETGELLRTAGRPPAPDRASRNARSDGEASEGNEPEAGLAPGLTALGGTLRRVDSGYLVDDRPVDFGPPWYLASTRAGHDFDGDGQIESLADELSVLVGREIRLGVELGRGGDADVFVIDGEELRPISGSPPWAGGPHRLGPAHPGSRAVERLGRSQAPAPSRGSALGPGDDGRERGGPSREAGSPKESGGPPSGAGHPDGVGAQSAGPDGGRASPGGPPPQAGGPHRTPADLRPTQAGPRRARAIPRPEAK